MNGARNKIGGIKKNENEKKYINISSKDFFPKIGILRVKEHSMLLKCDDCEINILFSALNIKGFSLLNKKYTGTYTSIRQVVIPYVITCITLKYV